MSFSFHKSVGAGYLVCTSSLRSLPMSMNKALQQSQHFRTVVHGWYTIDVVRRAFFIVVLAVLIADASGISSLVVSDPCSVSANESAPDGGCPAFCVRCSCGCCASPIVPMPIVVFTGVALPPIVVPTPPHDPLPSGIPLDILHVPKLLLT